MKFFIGVLLLSAYISYSAAGHGAGCPSNCQDEVWERIPCDATSPSPAIGIPDPIITLPTVPSPIVYRAKKQQGKPPGLPLSGEEVSSDEKQTRPIQGTKRSHSTSANRSNEKTEKIETSSQLEATSSEERQNAHKNQRHTHKTRPQTTTTTTHQRTPPTKPTQQMQTQKVPMLHSHSHVEEHVGAAYKYPAYHAAPPTYPTHRQFHSQPQPQIQRPIARYPGPAQQSFTNDDLAALMQAETYAGHEFKRGRSNMQSYINPSVSTAYQAPQRSMIMPHPRAPMAPSSLIELSNYARQMPYLNTNRISPLTRRGASLGSSAAALLSGGGFINPNEKPVFSLDIDGDVGNILSVQHADRTPSAAAKY